MKLKPAEIKSIAIFRALQLGDILCSIPAIRAIRRAYPDAQISFIGLSSSKAIISRFPQIFNDFISFVFEDYSASTKWYVCAVETC